MLSGAIIIIILNLMEQQLHVANNPSIDYVLHFSESSGRIVADANLRLGL